MGIVSFDDSYAAILENYRRMLMSCSAVHRRKDDDGIFFRREDVSSVGNGDALDRLVCVTSGVSYLGIAIVKQLLVNGYFVRIIVDKEEDVEKLREVEISGVHNNVVEVVMAKLNEVESLNQAFQGCRAVFHTAAFVDPSGLSGYTKAMCDVEVNATKNVIKACGVSPHVRHCVLTSSLLTCIWRDDSQQQLPTLIDHKCWSHESLCIDKKLWYALGKLRAEKAAWEIAKETGLNLAAICSGLINGPDYYTRSPSSTTAYLKGIQEMYTSGTMATVHIDWLAKAHVRVLEEMRKRKKMGGGRYICFDQLIKTADQIERLTSDAGISATVVTDGASCSNAGPFQLSGDRLGTLMSRVCNCRNE